MLSPRLAANICILLSEMDRCLEKIAMLFSKHNFMRSSDFPKLNRPEGNLTGVTFSGGSILGAKRLALLHELVPKISLVAVLLDPDATFEIELVETAARALGLQIVPVKLASERDLDAAFDRIVATGAGALLFGGGPVLRGHLHQIVALAARHTLPTIYELRDYVEAGGLISYGGKFPGCVSPGGSLCRPHPQGRETADLPVQQPTKFELVDQPQDRQGARPRPCRRRCSRAPTR